MPKTSSRSKQPSKVPVTSDIYLWAQTQTSAKRIAHVLLCSDATARAIRRDDRTVRVTPLELEAMQLQVRRLTTITALAGLKRLFKEPTEKQKKHVELMRAAAEFLVEYHDVLEKFKRKSKRPRVYSTVSWHRPLYILADLMNLQMIPHMRQTWHDLPECREMFFGGTGFEERFITPYYRNNVVRKDRRPSL